MEGIKLETLKRFQKQIRKKPVQFSRHVVQLLFAVFLLYVGIRFYQFYMHFATSGLKPFVARPAAVEGFLPISALVGLKVWLTTGYFDQIHPAGLILFTLFIGSGLFFRKSFCSWICPIGTISEYTGMFGKRLFKRSFDLPRWATWTLYPIKYLLLLFFLKLIAFDMPVMAATDFLNSPFNKISDVEMLLFFINISGFALKVLLILFVLSLFFKNFWCRFLCPYGALIGIGSLFRITKIKRNENTCINCDQCTKICPQRIRVSQKRAVNTPECTACMQCIEACPIKETLTVNVGSKKVNKWVLPACFLLLFILVVLIAKVSGKWETVISYNEFKDLIYTINSIGY
jgi:polyferredoxin